MALRRSTITKIEIWVLALSPPLLAALFHASTSWYCSRSQDLLKQRMAVEKVIPRMTEAANRAHAVLDRFASADTTEAEAAQTVAARIAASARKHDLVLTSLRPNAAAAAGGIPFVEMEMTAEGSLPEIAAFLHDLHDPTHLAAVQSTVLEVMRELEAPKYRGKFAIRFYAPQLPGGARTAGP